MVQVDKSMERKKAGK